jgi:uncharacterized protein YdaU (DUF1376 family)
MATEKAPAFQFYPEAWLSSTKIALMTPAQEGAYIRLLCYAWNDPDCSLPGDDATLAQLSRLNEGWFNGGSTVVRSCFTEHDGRLFNHRLLMEREKQRQWREKSRAGGVLSGRRRRESSYASKGGSTKREPNTTVPVEPNGNSLSLSLSLNKQHTLDQTSLIESPTNDMGKLPSIDNPPFNTLTPAKKAVKIDPWVHAWFDHEFWPIYPKHVGKRAALLKANSKAKEPDIRIAIMAGLRAQLGELLSREHRYRPNAETWLNQERWNDEVSAEGRPKSKVERMLEEIE